MVELRSGINFELSCDGRKDVGMGQVNLFVHKCTFIASIFEANGERTLIGLKAFALKEIDEAEPIARYSSRR
jgi:hypothetical protein